VRVLRLFLLLFLLGSWLVATAHAGEPSVEMEEPSARQGFIDDDLALFGEEPPPLRVYDPIEPVNRGIFWFNDKLYVYLLKPVARVYRVVPEDARVSVANFFANLATPVRLTNDLLQLRFKDASDELARFVFNSTFGIAGLFDIAREKGGISRKEEDFGQTLGHYGIGSGFYLVLPLLGPSNARDAVGRIGDYFLDPLPYALRQEEWIAINALDKETAISLDRDTYEGIKRDALDPYLFIRNAYAQKREAAIEE
jgi:phospholipid-binding lipoprotein MlaA